jgi:hypothetical protein
MLSLDLSLCMRICNAGMLKQRQGHSDINEFLHPVISNETTKKATATWLLIIFSVVDES